MVLRHRGKTALDAGVRAAVKLKLEAAAIEPVREWALDQVDPARLLIRPGGALTFDKGIAITPRGEAGLYSSEGLAPDTKALPMQKKVLPPRPGEPPEGQLKSSAMPLRGVEVHNPRRGSIHAPGAALQVVWTISSAVEGRGEGPWEIFLGRGEWQYGPEPESLARLYSGPAAPGTPVAVPLPGDIPESDDYVIQVFGNDVSGLSGTFSVSALALPGSDAAVPEAIELVEPSGGETWIKGLPAAIKWRIWPLHRPVWDHLMIALLQEDGSAAKTYSIDANYRDLRFDNATREYTWVDFPRPEPGRYRVAVYALLPGDGGAGEVHLGIGADHEAV